MTKRDVLTALIEFSKSVDSLAASLQTIPWDSDDAIVTLTSRHVLHAISKCLRGDISPADLQKWAELIEVREDIDFDANHFAEINDVMFTIANPDINGELSPANLKDCLSRLTR